MSKGLTDAIRRLTENPGLEPLPMPQPRGAAPRVVAAATPPSVAVAPEGGGIASPLNETARTYYAERTVTTTDGLLTVRVRPIQTMSFADANGDPVAFNFADPT
jgi:hypothetical protein